MCQHNRKANRCAECVAHLGPDATPLSRAVCFGLNDGVHAAPVCAPSVYEDLADPGPVLSPEEKREIRFQASLLRQNRRKLWSDVFTRYIAFSYVTPTAAARCADKAVELFDERVKKGVL